MAQVAKGIHRIFIPPRVDFSWAPTSSSASISVGGTVYPYTHQQDGVTRTTDNRYSAVTTPTNTLITFTAIVTPFNATVVRYHWDFGDGTEAFGPTATKTYFVPNPTVAVRLQVQDSNGEIASATHGLNLVVSKPIRTKFTRR